MREKTIGIPAARGRVGRPDPSHKAGFRVNPLGDNILIYPQEFGTLLASIKENTRIMDTIKTLGDFRKLTKDLDDDFAIEFRVRRRVPEEELKTRRYPYPYDTEYFEGFEFDDIGYSDKAICFGVCLGDWEI